MIEKLNSIVDSFMDKKILVIGDLMIDEYIWGSVSRVSPEAPVPVVLEKKRERRPGGALNVVSNLLSLGAKPLIAGIIGDDAGGDYIKEYLKKNKIEAGGMATASARPTTVKTRVIGNNQQIVRLDAETAGSTGKAETESIIRYIESKTSVISAIIISDYNKGMINEPILQSVKKLSAEKNIFTSVDPQVKHYRLYNDLSLITPNHHEAGAFTGISIDDEDSLHKAAKKIMDEINPGLLLVTLGENGMMLYEKNAGFTHVPTIARHVYDVTGAGDTVITVFTMAMACGASPEEAAVLSNIAAGYVVGEVGTTAIPFNILKERLKPEFIPL